MSDVCTSLCYFYPARKYTMINYCYYHNPENKSLVGPTSLPEKFVLSSTIQLDDETTWSILKPLDTGCVCQMYIPVFLIGIINEELQCF